MTPGVFVVVVGGASAQLSAEPHLESWATARQVRLLEPASSAAPLAHSSDKDVRRAEKLLEQARVALGALDDDGVKRKLAAVERLLRDQPALPQAAWLMAEHHALKIALLSRIGGPTQELARLAHARAVLEGRRAPALGQTPPAVPAPVADTQVKLPGLRKGDRVFWNGERQAAPPKVPAGEHHLRVVRRGRVAVARWVSVSPKSPAITIPSATPCSSEDLTGARVSGDRALPPKGASCPRWILVRSTARGIDVARCNASSCGPLLPWRQGNGAVLERSPQSREPTPFPTWVAVGTVVGAAIVTTIVLWNTGVFEERERGKTRFVFTGPSETQGLRY